MGLISNLFRKASELDFQDRRIVILESELARANAELTLAKKVIDAARSSENKTLRRHADMMSQKAGLTPAFVKDATPKEAETLIEYDDEMERRITAAAKLQRNIDPEPQPLEFYEDAVRKDPERYLPH